MPSTFPGLACRAIPVAFGDAFCCFLLLSAAFWGSASQGEAQERLWWKLESFQKVLLDEFHPGGDGG